MEYIITAAYLVVFLFIIARLPLFHTAAIRSRVFGWIFVLKVAAGIFLGLLYRYYFNGGDTHTYFENAMIMHGFIHEDPVIYLKMIFAVDDPSLRPYYHRLLDWDNMDYFYNDSHTIVRLNALLRLFSFGIYNVHVIFFCFMSLTGLACLYRCFVAVLPGRDRTLLWAVFLVPSVLFWSSGILKEGLLMFGLGILFYSQHQLVIEGKWHYAVPAFLSIVLLLFLKVYILMLLFPGIVAWLWSESSPPALAVLKFVVVYGACSILLLSARLISPNLSVESVIYWKQVNSVNLAENMESRSKIDPPALEDRLGSLFFKAPAAFAFTLLRPAPGHAHNPFSAMAAAENVILIGILVLSLAFAGKPPQQAVPLVLLCLTFTVLLFILIGFTTATAGNLVRYKMPALPLFLFCAIAVFRPEKLKARLGLRR